MVWVVVAHAVLILAAVLLAPRLGPRTFLVAALGPLSGVILLAVSARDVWAGRAWTSTVDWVPGLDLALRLRLDGLSWLMLVLVCGVGAVIFTYCAWYAHRDPMLTRFVATMTAFAGSMAGLVLADDVLLLYVFWELTSVTSYLLVGLRVDDATSRRAALQALLTTVLGGLAMFAGLLMLADAAGTATLSRIVQHPPEGPLVGTALGLVLAGALTKSAQVPFHGWLPAAMAAPTPVSAYLHAAAMVKAGIYLVARLSPGFAHDIDWWRPTLAVFGALTLIVGGYRALRQHDLKRLLAFSTVSQLGLLMVAAGWGGAQATTAIGVLLLAHGLAKAGLFLSLGAVDHQAGSRDLRELDGLGRRMPVLAVAAALVAASMAGVPLALGFIAKEELLTTLTGHPGTVAAATTAAVVVGSALTAGYTARFWWGAFGPRPATRQDDPDAPGAGHRRLGADVQAPAIGMTGPITLLAALSVLLGVAPALLDRPLSALWSGDPDAAPVHLAFWHGFTPVLGLSLLALAGGGLLIAGRRPAGRVQQGVGRALPTWLSVDVAYGALVRGLDRFSAAVTGLTQNGSLPFYLGTTALTAVLLPAGALLAGAGPQVGSLPWHDGWAQVPVAGLIAAAAVSLCLIANRLAAVIVLGTVGYGLALLFVLQGAPDLALTQLLVESLSIVVFLFVMRLLPAHFPPQRWKGSTATRAGIALVVGAVMTGLTLAAMASRTRAPVSAAMVERAYPDAHGHNIVNVIIVDFRGLDTLGEGTVVAVAALSLVSLVLTARRSAEPAGSVVPPSLILTIGVRVAFPAAVAVSLYFLFAGHNRPGGGFIGGLTAGGGFALLYLAGRSRPLPQVFAPMRLIGAGLVLAVLTALTPLLFGGDVLTSGYTKLTVPVLGQVGLPSVLAFDSGIYLIVVGFVLTALDTLGSRRETSLGRADEETRL